MVKLQYIIASLIILCGISFGQVMPTQVFSVTNTLTATGVDTGYNIKASSINALVLSWSSESGTNTTCAMQIEVSVDNVTYAQPSGGSSQTCTSNGSFTLSVLPANFIHVNLTILTGAGNTIRYRLAGYSGPYDPCANAILKQTPVSIAQAASTQEIAATVAGMAPRVCGGQLAVSGPTSPTATFKTGTNGGTPCSAGAVSLTGAMSPGASGVVPIIPGAYSSFVTGAIGGEICLTGAGTTPSLTGSLNIIYSPYL